MSYRPELIVELVDAINAQNDLNIKAEDIGISTFAFNGEEASVKLVKGNGDYYGRKYVSYRRLDPSKFFKNIPVKAFVDNYSKVLSGFQILYLINEQWPDLIEYTDVVQEDLDKEYTLGEATSKPVEFRLKDESGTWVGKFSLLMAQKLINLSYIIESNPAITLAGPSASTMRTYSADFTPYSFWLSQMKVGRGPDSDFTYLLERGLNDVNLVGASVLYNGLTTDATDYKVNAKYSNVLILKPLGGKDEDLVYIHYNYNSIPASAVATEDGQAVTTESGDILVTE